MVCSSWRSDSEEAADAESRLQVGGWRQVHQRRSACLLEFASHGSNCAVAKFLPNPEENWGPKARAGGRGTKRKAEDDAEAEDAEGAEADDEGDADGDASMDSKADGKAAAKAGKTAGKAKTDADNADDEVEEEDIGAALGRQLKEKSKANQGKNKAKRRKKEAEAAGHVPHAKRPCNNFFRNGACKFGDKCKFSHVKPAADEAKDNSAASVAAAAASSSAPAAAASAAMDESS